MELFLNILWVLIALAALGVWRCEWKRQESHAARKPWQQWTAFACALIFVFFAVSLSDDLHAAAILADDCLVGRHHSLTWNCGCAAHGDGHAIRVSLAPAPVAPISNPLREEAQIVPVSFGLARVSIRANKALRGPPGDSL